MDLQPSDQSPGHWVNQDWSEGSPGLFAVVIGVSKYRHLNGGEQPAGDTLGLGQLPVSAITAYRVFDWLRTTYRHDKAPLAECWLLMSPTDNEIGIEAEIGTHQTLPDLDACKRALQFWRARMDDIPEQSAKKSRALFFFSGHGLETHLQNQILLPEDYLYPPGNNFNDGISPWNLYRSLSSIKVPEQFFFIDACRNDTKKLRAKQIRGQILLPEDESALSNSDVVAPIFYATAPGLQAFSPKKASDGLSLFGQALVDGLHGNPKIELSTYGELPSVDVFPLQQYMKAHIVERLKALGAKVKQQIKLNGTVDDVPITLIDQPGAGIGTGTGTGTGTGGDAVFRGSSNFDPLPRPSTSAPLPRAPSAHSGSVDDVLRTKATSPTSDAETRSLAEDVNEGFERLYRLSRTLDADLGFLRNQSSRAHETFGSEQITALLIGDVRIFALGEGQWIDENSLHISRVDRDLNKAALRAFITIKHADQRGHWLRLRDLDDGFVGCVLPTDGGKPVNFVLEMGFEEKEAPKGAIRLASIESSLSSDNDGPLCDAAQIWYHSKVAHLGAAIATFQSSKVKAMLQGVGSGGGAVFSPLAAMVAANILSQGNKFGMLLESLSDTRLRGAELMALINNQVDFSIFWAQDELRHANGKVGAAPAALNRLLERRGLPSSVEGLSLASTLIQSLSREARKHPKLKALEEKIENALSHLSDAGLFAAYVDIEDYEDPRELIGPWP